MIYFVPEAAEAYARLGITGRTGYFASRAAPMGAVTAEVVVSTFFNFNPELVHSSHPRVWEIASPDACWSALASKRLTQRFGALLGDAVVRRRRCTEPPRWRAAGRDRRHRTLRDGPSVRGPRRPAVARRTASGALACPVDPARVPGRRPHRPAGHAWAVGNRGTGHPRGGRRRAG